MYDVPFWYLPTSRVFLCTLADIRNRLATAPPLVDRAVQRRAGQSLLTDIFLTRNDQNVKITGFMCFFYYYFTDHRVSCSVLTDEEHCPCVNLPSPRRLTHSTGSSENFPHREGSQGFISAKEKKEEKRMRALENDIFFLSTGINGRLSIINFGKGLFAQDHSLL